MSTLSPMAIVDSLTRILRLYSCSMLFLAGASFASASCPNISHCSGVSGTTLGTPELRLKPVRGWLGDTPVVEWARIVVPPQELSQRLLLVLTAYFRLSFQQLAELLHKGTRPYRLPEATPASPIGACTPHRSMYALNRWDWKPVGLSVF